MTRGQSVPKTMANICVKNRFHFLHATLYIFRHVIDGDIIVKVRGRRTKHSINQLSLDMQLNIAANKLFDNNVDI